CSKRLMPWQMAASISPDVFITTFPYRSLSSAGIFFRFLPWRFGRRHVADHAQNPDHPAGDIAQSGAVDKPRDDASLFADAWFFNRPGIGLGLEDPRKLIHVALAIQRI